MSCSVHCRRILPAQSIVSSQIMREHTMPSDSLFGRSNRKLKFLSGCRLPVNHLLPTSKTTQGHGSIAPFQHLTPTTTNISKPWKQAIRTFVRCLNWDIQHGDYHDDFYLLLPVLKRMYTYVFFFFLVSAIYDTTCLFL